MEKVLKTMSHRVVFLGLQALLSVLLLNFVMRLNILPFRYSLLLIIAFILLLIMTFLLTIPAGNEKGRNMRTLVGRVLSLVISACMMIGCIYVAAGTSFLKKTTGNKTETVAYSLVVMASSAFNTISDVKGKKVAYNPNMDEDALPLVLSNFEKECSKYEKTLVYDYDSLADALYNGECDAILMNEGYRSIMNTHHENFDSTTRIIWETEVEVEIEEGTDQVVTDVTDTPFILYISGVDSRGSVNVKSRSDVNMIVTINPSTHDILLTSIPRDMYVKLAAEGDYDKLTHSGLQGTSNTVATVSNWLSLDIPYYVRVNFQALVKVVDAIGGVDVYSDKALKSKGIKKGMNHMDGEKALAFCRERYSYAAGDRHRVANQQAVLTAIIQKMLSPKLLTNYMSILNAVGDSFTTSMPMSQIEKLISMQLEDQRSWDISTSMINGTGKYTTGYYIKRTKEYYMIPDEDSVAKNVKAINDVLEGKSPTTEEEKTDN